MGIGVPSAGVTIGQVVLQDKADGSPAAATGRHIAAHCEPRRCECHNLYIGDSLTMRVYKDTHGWHHTLESLPLRCKRKSMGCGLLT